MLKGPLTVHPSSELPSKPTKVHGFSIGGIVVIQVVLQQLLHPGPVRYFFIPALLAVHPRLQKVTPGDAALHKRLLVTHAAQVVLVGKLHLTMAVAGGVFRKAVNNTTSSDEDLENAHR